MTDFTDKLQELARRLGQRLRLAPDAERDVALAGAAMPDWADGIPRGGKTGALVCVLLDERGLILPDNRSGRCKECRRPVQFRPSAPKRIVKLCIDCALRQARGDA